MYNIYNQPLSRQKCDKLKIVKLIVGLGNPGEKYHNNRHNVGHLFIEYLVSCSQYPVSQVKFFKTDVFMNDSGKSVQILKTRYKILNTNLYVVHDDLDIPLGQYKIQLGVGPKVHYGINSVEQSLGTKDFWRIRIGVDARRAESRTAGEDYVLEDFSLEEKKVLDKVFFEIYANFKVGSHKF